MNAYQAGFTDKCSSKGIAAAALIKKAQQSGIASGALSSLLEQPMIRDAASGYAASKAGEIAKLLQMLKMLKAGGEPVSSSMR